jgi:hypothetical protein
MLGRYKKIKSKLIVNIDEDTQNQYYAYNVDY